MERFNYLAPKCEVLRLSTEGALLDSSAPKFDSVDLYEYYEEG